jgi:hypothetical protein
MTNGLLYQPPPHPPLLNKSWEDWTADWWKRLLGIRDTINPVNDPTGDLQGQNQPPEAFFLAGAHTKRAQRKCNIPAAKPILFPVAVMSASQAEFPGSSTAKLASLAQDGNQVVDMELIIDGTTIDKQSLLNYRVQTPSFEVTMPEDNIHLYSNGGKTQVVSDGYWVFLKPLKTPPKDHTIIFRQQTQDHPPSGTLNCSYDITYKLTLI